MGVSRRCSLFVSLLLACLVATLAPATPALATAACSASTCDGQSPLSPTIVSGCGSWAKVSGIGDPNFATVTILYSKTCRAAYAQMVLPSPSTVDTHSLLALYQPQYGGPEHSTGGV